MTEKILRKGKFEQTVVIIKPDSVMRDLPEIIIEMLEENQLNVATSYKMVFTEAEAELLVHEEPSSKTHDECVDYMQIGESLVMLVEGIAAVQAVLELAGAPSPKMAEAGTIRQKYGVDDIHNCVYVSPDLKTATAEVKRFFKLKK